MRAPLPELAILLSRANLLDGLAPDNGPVLPEL